MTEASREAFVKAVRSKPPMYVGNPPEAAHVIVRQCLSDCIRQFLDGKATFIHIDLGPGGEIVIRDDGEGRPFDAERAESFGAILPASALSSEFHITTWRSGTQWMQSFRCGQPLAPPEIHEDSSGRGTILRFTLDTSFLPGLNLNRPLLRGELFDKVHIFPGLTIRYLNECFHAPHGFADLLCCAWHIPAQERHAPLFSVTVTSEENVESEPVVIHAAAAGTVTSPDETLWRSWANGEATPLHGRHVSGFRAALLASGWCPRFAMIHAIIDRPRFFHSVKDHVINAGLDGAVRQALAAPLKAFVRSVQQEAR